MSIRDTLEKRLVDHGLWPAEAKTVMDLVVAAKTNEPMADRWNESPDDYPPAILALGWMSAQQHTLDWIDANHPQHWARAMLSS